MTNVTVDRLAAIERRWIALLPWLRRFGGVLLWAFAVAFAFGEWTTRGARLAQLDTTGAARLLAAGAWPITVVVIVVVLRIPLGRFLASFAGRISKLSILQVEITLAEVAATVTATEPSMRDIREADANSFLNDSSRELFRKFASEPPAEAVLIDLGDGNEWLTSRLYIYGYLLRRFKGLRYVVFVSSKRGKRRFVGVTSVESVERVLSLQSPWLEAALAHACAMHADTRNPGEGANPANDAWLVDRLVGQSLQSLQQRTPLPPGPGWVSLKPPVWEHAEWIDRSKALQLFSGDFESRISRASNDRDLMIEIIDKKGDIVAVTSDGELERLIDRRAALELIASRWAASAQHDAA